jgi:hypothetical protein
LFKISSRFGDFGPIRVFVMSSATQQATPAPAGATARIQLLGVNNPSAALEARVARRDGKILHLLTDTAVGSGLAVRIDVDGGMILGEVVGCQSLPAGCDLAIHIDQIVPSVSELAKLVERVLCESRSMGQQQTERAARV